MAYLPDLILADNPRAYWALAEIGPPYADAVAGRDLVLQDEAAPVAIFDGYVGRAQRFEIEAGGALRRIPMLRAANAGDFDAPAGASFAWVAWVRVIELGASIGVVMARRNSLGELNVFLGVDATAVARFHARDTTASANLDVLGTTALDDGNWHYIAGIVDNAAGEIRVVVDGVTEAAAAGTFADSFADANTPLTVGFYDHASPGFHYYGDIDELAVFDAALGDAQLAAHVNADTVAAVASAGPRIADRVKETTATAGTGAYALAGPQSGFRGFVAALGDGNDAVYSAEDGLGGYEVGVGTLAAGTPDALSREEILASSNGGAAVDWAAGEKDIFVTLSSAYAVAARKPGAGDAGKVLQVAPDEAGYRLAPAPRFRGALVTLGHNTVIDLDSANNPNYVPWDFAVYDTDGWWNSAAAQRLTVPPGVQWVRVAAALFVDDLDGTGDSDFQFKIRKNGEEMRPEVVDGRDTGFLYRWGLPRTPVVPVVAGDYFEANINAHANVPLKGENNYCWCQIEAVG